MTIGFTLLPVGIKYSAGCGAYPAGFCQKAGFGDIGNWAMALFVILVILLIRRFGKGVWSTASVFIGIVVGYLVAIPFGMFNPRKVEGHCKGRLDRPARPVVRPRILDAGRARA